MDFIHRIVELLRMGNHEQVIVKITNEGYDYVRFNHSANAVVDTLLGVLKDSI